MEYKVHEIEKKWQEYWQKNECFKAKDFDARPKYYALVEFPYPSGAAMHIGHLRAYSALEVIARRKRMEGYNVLFPIGFDAFGLPTENYAIRTGKHPRTVTDTNIACFLEQLARGGFSFDLSRTIDTTQEDYYKWTQWIFLQLFKKGLAYKSNTKVNFCPDCKVILSNEECQNGICDRCESEVVLQEKDVWFLRITEYSKKLLDGLKDIDTSTRIKVEQENWIGKSEGAYIDFQIANTAEKIKVFTTRPDTVFGANFMVIAPEHPVLNSLEHLIENAKEIASYKEQASKKSEFDRVHINKEKSGVIVNGVKVINPLTKKAIDLFIADYVMIEYGSGAIMGVPAHDARDYDFALKYNLPITEVIAGGDVASAAYTDTNEGILVNSGFLDGMSVKDAKEAIIEYIEENGIGIKSTNYKMKDWAFNRQRYWGEPIPIINCPKCGQVPVKEEDLPVRLPKTEKIKVTDTGESPLALIKDFVECKCPMCGGDARRETDTMPQWAGSSWYFLRYCDPHNQEQFASLENLNYWMPVDWYNGGMEHVTRHVIYARFWHHFLYDIGVVNTKEPFLRRTAQGLILGEDGEKMSKNRGNGVNAIDLFNEFGADAARLCILFIGDYEQSTPWNPQIVKGCKRFLERLWRLFDGIDMKQEGYSASLSRKIHQTIKKVSADILDLKMNTAIAAMMELLNAYYQTPSISKDDYILLLRLLHPFAPHMTEELNEMLGEMPLHNTKWPTYNVEETVEDAVTYVVSVNGKVRDKIELSKDLTKEELEESALSSLKVQQFLTSPVKKIIIVPNKIINIVI